MKEKLNRIWENVKNFFQSKTGKISMITVAAVVVLAGFIVGGYSLWLYQQPKFQDLTVELGTESVHITQFMTRYANLNKVGFISDPGVIDLNHVGETEVTLRHGNQTQTVLFRVEDTTAPEVTFVTSLTKTESYVPAAEDFVESVSDLDETTVSFEQDVVIPVGYTDTLCLVSVTDASGNTTTGKCILHFGRVRKDVTLEYGTPLTKADILLNPQEDGHMINQADIDAINQAHPGEYVIVANVDGKEETCTVTVQDTTGPELVIKDVSIKPGQSIDMDDFIVSVSDRSGGIRLVLKTPLDNRKEETQKAVIEAEDPYGNITVAEAVLRVTEDNEEPKITFDHDYVQAYCGGEAPNYMEGVTAIDEVDGNCMVIYDDSKVNLDEVGTYKVYYTATDRSGNTTRKSRDVEVTFDYFNSTLTDEAKALLEVHGANLSDDPEEIRDYVRDKIKYNSNWGGDDPISYGFNTRKGNCYVHALILKALLDAKGHETQLIWVENHTHYWVVIKIGDVWRHIDATPSRGFHNKYSLMDDVQRLETLKGRDWDREQWPACE